MMGRMKDVVQALPASLGEQLGGSLALGAGRQHLLDSNQAILKHSQFFPRVGVGAKADAVG